VTALIYLVDTQAGRSSVFSPGWLVSAWDGYYTVWWQSGTVWIKYVGSLLQRSNSKTFILTRIINDFFKKCCLVSTWNYTSSQNSLTNWSYGY